MSRSIQPAQLLGVVLTGLLFALVIVPNLQLTAAQKATTDQASGDKAAKNEKKGLGKKGMGKGKQADGATAKGSIAPRSAVEAGVPVLSSGDSYDDFASIAEAPDGSVYAAYAAYFDAHDQIRIHKKLPSGAWSNHSVAPLVQARADIWMPQVAVDAAGRLWVIWSEQTDQTRTESGNWDLYARARLGDGWGPLVRLTTDPKPDINHHVVVDSKRNIYVVWQGHAGNHGDVMLCKFDGDNWSKPLTVTSGTSSDWYPQAAVDAQGTVWIAFDSYRRGDYDVYLTSVKNNTPGEVLPIATSNFYEAHASVTTTADGKVWVAWEQGGWNWGKDQGYWLKQIGQESTAQKVAEAHPAGGGAGSTLGSARRVRTAVWHEGKLLAGPAVPALEGENDQANTAMAGLTTDGDDRVWLRYRHQNRKAPGANGKGSRYWVEAVTHLTGDGWSKPVVLPGSEGRITVFSRIVPASQGGVYIAYSSDQRGPANYHQPIHDRALVTHLPRPETPTSQPTLAPYTAPDAPPGAKPWDAPREDEQVAAVRAYRATIDGQPHQIVRGDMHRHTEMSWDVGPGNDGSYLDFYRYMIDVAAMDFGGLTDHQGGGHYAYHWWLTEKSSDLYYLAPRFVPLYGYERSAKFPDGHRNIFHAYRGVPVFPFQTRLGLSGVFPGVGTGELVQNDTKLLYEYLHRTQGIAISHTSGTDSMGTDWRDNDPFIEPVVEIYQGARNSYEALGAPRVHDIANQPAAAAPGGFQAAGMLWNAYEKGYRLGTTASSDHGSTHISYSLLYVTENKREPIIASMRKRHTYGSTDNVILEAWANNHFMGDEFQSAEKPVLKLKVTGTNAIERIDLVRNNNYVYTAAPKTGATATVSYIDMEPKTGLNMYYFRVQQADGEIAWASPVWVNYTP